MFYDLTREDKTNLFKMHFTIVSTVTWIKYPKCEVVYLAQHDNIKKVLVFVLIFKYVAHIAN